jgi:hypothetical protein
VVKLCDCQLGPTNKFLSLGFTTENENGNSLSFV